MATSSSASAPVLLVLAVAAVAVSLMSAAAADDSSNGSSTMTHLSFFMHDITSGSDPTSVKVIKGPGSTATAPALGMTFGDTNVMDDAVTATSSASSAAVGRMQGIYMLASQSAPGALMVCANLVLTSGPHNGSTLAVMGRDDTGEDVREIPVVGGTGAFRMATGYVLWKTPAGLNGTADATVQLDVYVTTDATALAPAPAPGGAGGAGDGSGGGGGGGGGSSSSKSSSGAARRMSGGGWVVAVVVAVVGSSWLW